MVAACLQQVRWLDNCSGLIETCTDCAVASLQQLQHEGTAMGIMQHDHSVHIGIAKDLGMHACLLVQSSGGSSGD